MIAEIYSASNFGFEVVLKLELDENYYRFY